MNQLMQITQSLTRALSNMLNVAHADPDGDAVDAMRFDSVTTIAGDVLTEAEGATEPSVELALKVAGSLRTVTSFAHPAIGAGLHEGGLFRVARESAIATLAEFGRYPLALHAHYETALYRDDEEFPAIALTTNDEATYDREGTPGEILAYVPFECPAGVELAKRLAHLSWQPNYGDAEQVGNALRSSAALIKALLAGEHRSEGDLRDVLANFDGLALD